MYIQYGCGLSAPKGWVNYDSSPSLIISKIPLLRIVLRKHIPLFPSNVKYGDIVKGLKLEKSSCQGIYASHVLEHLSLTDLRIALKNTYNLLVKDGIFRLVVPDLEWSINKYYKSNLPDRSYEFLQDTHLGIIKREKGITGAFRNILGNSIHLWMWDYESLRNELKNAGFINIRRAEFNDSVDQNFKKVEDAGRFVNALAFECKK
jgi:predicted SAM-dependent methyltransferase